MLTAFHSPDLALLPFLVGCVLYLVWYAAYRNRLQKGKWTIASLLVLTLFVAITCGVIVWVRGR